MLIFYRILTILFLILSPIILIIRLSKKKEDPKRFQEKFCFFSKKKKKGNEIWFNGDLFGKLKRILHFYKNLIKKKK